MNSKKTTKISMMIMFILFAPFILCDFSYGSSSDSCGVALINAVGLTVNYWLSVDAYTRILAAIIVPFLIGFGVSSEKKAQYIPSILLIIGVFLFFTLWILIGWSLYDNSSPTCSDSSILNYLHINLIFSFLILSFICTVFIK